MEKALGRTSQQRGITDDHANLHGSGKSLTTQYVRRAAGWLDGSTNDVCALCVSANGHVIHNQGTV